jgi:hypothetical protein
MDEGGERGEENQNDEKREEYITNARYEKIIGRFGQKMRKEETCWMSYVHMSMTIQPFC